jgi:hypothetical protein
MVRTVMLGDKQFVASEVEAFLNSAAGSREREDTEDECLITEPSWLDTAEESAPILPKVPTVPAPRTPPPAAVAEASAEDDAFAPFRKLQRINLPQPAIEQRMRASGFTESQIRDFSEGKACSGVVPNDISGSSPSPLISATALKSLAPASSSGSVAAPNSPSLGNSLLASITQGTKLKATVQRRPESVVAAKYAGSMLLSLASAMSSRRKVLQHEDDSDSDGGFTDSDDD